jgi:hypothetical protein
MLLALLALDSAGFFHGDLTPDVAAVIALIVGVVALVFDVRARGVL